MVAVVNDEILYTFNSKCQKSSKSHASFFFLKVVGDSCQKITLLLLKRKSVRVIVPESCF